MVKESRRRSRGVGVPGVGGSEASTLNRMLGTRDSARRSGVEGSSGTYVLSDHTRTKRGLQDCGPGSKLVVFVPRSTGMLWLRASRGGLGLLALRRGVVVAAGSSGGSSICSVGRMDGRKERFNPRRKS